MRMNNLWIQIVMIYQINLLWEDQNYQFLNREVKNF